MAFGRPSTGASQQRPVGPELASLSNQPCCPFHHSAPTTLPPASRIMHHSANSRLGPPGLASTALSSALRAVVGLAIWPKNAKTVFLAFRPFSALPTGLRPFRGHLPGLIQGCPTTLHKVAKVLGRPVSFLAFSGLCGGLLAFFLPSA